MSIRTYTWMTHIAVPLCTNSTAACTHTHTPVDGTDAGGTLRCSIMHTDSIIRDREHEHEQVHWYDVTPTPMHILNSGMAYDLVPGTMNKSHELYQIQLRMMRTN